MINTAKQIKPIEHKMILLLGMQGYDKKELRFKTNCNNDRYFKYGYWRGINEESIDYLQHHCQVIIEEVSWYDDDCGRKYAYNFIEPTTRN